MICCMVTLSTCSLGYGQAKFCKDLFHILPDLSAIVIGIIPQQVNKKSRFIGIPFSPL